MSEVRITVYRWAGEWGPFKVRIPCGECTLTRDIIEDTIANELDGYDVELEVHDWLSEWWKPLLKGGWHAPIVMVNGRIVSQGEALNRALLAQRVIEAAALDRPVAGTQIYGKETCPYCIRGKDLLDREGIEFAYHDVIADPASLYEMLVRVKPIVGPRTPVTVPQVWLEGRYIGGASDLERALDERREAAVCVEAAG